MKSYRFIHLLYLLFLSVSLVSCDKDNDSEVLSHLFFGEESGKSGDDTGDKDDKYDQSKQYVDLGLSVKWATCNIGACVPEDYGYYYVWGETELKKICSWDTYKYCKSFDNMTKYCNSIAYGYNEFTDTLTTLTPDDDVAYVKWGGDWRMPTQADFDELLNNCDWVWTTQNGVKGYKVTSRKDSSLSIFMPVAGYRQGTMIPPNSGGKYWSSSLYTDTPDRAWTLSFNSVAQHIGYEQRIYGLSVRPVCP